MGEVLAPAGERPVVGREVVLEVVTNLVTRKRASFTQRECTIFIFLRSSLRENLVMDTTTTWHGSNRVRYFWELSLTNKKSVRAKNTVERCLVL